MRSPACRWDCYLILLKLWSLNWTLLFINKEQARHRISLPLNSQSEREKNQYSTNCEPISRQTSETVPESRKRNTRPLNRQTNGRNSNYKFGLRFWFLFYLSDEANAEIPKFSPWYGKYFHRKRHWIQMKSKLVTNLEIEMKILNVGIAADASLFTCLKMTSSEMIFCAKECRQV